MTIRFILAVFWSFALFAGFQPVDINVASKEQLRILPGVGNILANRIIEYRTSHGGFKSVEELAQVEGVKPKLFDDVRPKIMISKYLGTARGKSKVQEARHEQQQGGQSLVHLLYQYRDEPTVQEVQKMAIEYASLQPKLINEWLRKVRAAPWLPKFKTGLTHDADSGQSIREKIGEPNTLFTRDFANLRAHLDMEWQLNKLIFNEEEINIMHENNRQTTLRMQVIDAVTEIYFARRKAQLECKLRNESAEEALLHQVRIEELSAQIDGFTGGWWSEQLAKASQAIVR